MYVSACSRVRAQRQSTRLLQGRLSSGPGPQNQALGAFSVLASLKGWILRTYERVVEMSVVT